MNNSGQRLQPERRSSFRILTLKNAGWLALALTVLFLLFSTYMEHRSRGTESYGRLYDRRIEDTRPAATATVAPPAAPPERKPIRPRRGDERVVIPPATTTAP